MNRTASKKQIPISKGPFFDIDVLTLAAACLAMLAARQTKLPQRVVKAMNETPKYPEGTGVRLEVKSARDIGALKKHAAVKLAN